jgi:hypothetical protein
MQENSRVDVTFRYGNATGFVVGFVSEASSRGVTILRVLSSPISPPEEVLRLSVPFSSDTVATFVLPREFPDCVSVRIESGGVGLLIVGPDPSLFHL